MLGTNKVKDPVRIIRLMLLQYQDICDTPIYETSKIQCVTKEVPTAPMTNDLKLSKKNLEGSQLQQY